MNRRNFLTFVPATAALTWTVTCKFEEEEHKKEEAIETARGDSTALPTNSAYVEASFEVDTEIVEAYNQENCL